MSMPPQPGPWGPGPQPPGPQQPPPGYYTPQQPWGPSQPPPKQSSGLKWLLIAVGVLLVIAISVGVTLFVTRDSGGGSTTASPTAGDGIVSANDTGPVSIITSEPTCASWRPIQDSLAASQSDTWGSRDPSSTASSWNSDLRGQYESAAAGMRSAADRAVVLAKQTPHRAVREMYEQFIAYGRAYADSLASYVPSDDALSRANVSFSKTISAICDAIDFGSVVTQAATVKDAKSPSQRGEIGDIAKPTRFLTSSNPSCADWLNNDASFTTNTDAWAEIDSKLAANQWTPDQRDVQLKAAKTFSDYADSTESLGRRSNNAVFEDIATLAAQYFRAYANAIPSYVVADGYLVVPALRMNNAISYSCKSVGS